MTAPDAPPNTGASSTPLPSPSLAVVVPVHNEAENVEPLIDEIRAALGPGGRPFEIIYVDDGSSDATLETLQALATRHPELRVLRHKACCGQSAAVATGVRAALAPIVATLDGDGQNDPADIPSLVEALERDTDPDHLLIAGHRAKRKDTAYKRFQSRIANRIRAGLLKDATPDTGCGLKVFTREAFLDMPRFDHMHRFLPALMIRRGGRVTSVPVHHRPRERGQSKYGMFDRLRVGIVDLLGVMWLQRRGSKPEVEEVTDGAESR